VKGTGLGLPLSKRLTELLGGRLSVSSEPGVGSTFEAAIPIRYRAQRLRADEPALSWHVDPARLPVLVIEDGFETQLFYDKILKGTLFQLFPARSLADAREGLARMKPRAILLDILLNDAETWDFLVDVKQRPETRDIPVIVISTVNDTYKGLSLGADRYAVKPVERQWLLNALAEVTGATRSLTRVLVVDDQPAMRHVIGQLLDRSRHAIAEASTGEEAMRLAAAWQPDIILLDLGLPDMDGGDVLMRLTLDPATARTPVVIVSSRPASDPTFASISAMAAGIVPKEALTSDALHGAISRALAHPAPEAAHG
jgi:CheY-like chemotaxis protein